MGRKKKKKRKKKTHHVAFLPGFLEEKTMRFNFYHKREKNLVVQGGCVYAFIVRNPIFETMLGRWYRLILRVNLSKGKRKKIKKLKLNKPYEITDTTPPEYLRSSDTEPMGKKKIINPKDKTKKHKPFPSPP